MVVHGRRGPQSDRVNMGEVSENERLSASLPYTQKGCFNATPIDKAIGGQLLPARWP